MVPVVMVPVAIVAAPVMVISRTVVVARVDAEHAIDTADRPAHGAADDPADRTSSSVAFRRATFHAAKNALSMSGDWRGEQSHNHGYSKFLPHRYSSIPNSIFRLTLSLRVSSTGGQRRHWAPPSESRRSKQQVFAP
jgi:hypothetical protein